MQFPQKQKKRRFLLKNYTKTVTIKIYVCENYDERFSVRFDSKEEI